MTGNAWNKQKNARVSIPGQIRVILSSDSLCCDFYLFLVPIILELE